MIIVPSSLFLLIPRRKWGTICRFSKDFSGDIVFHESARHMWLQVVIEGESWPRNRPPSTTLGSEITATRYTFNVLTTTNRTATFLFVARKRFFSMAADVSRYPEAGCECSWLWKIPTRSFGNLKLLKPIISDDYDEKTIRVCTCCATALSPVKRWTGSGECLLRPLYTARETRCGIFTIYIELLCRTSVETAILSSISILSPPSNTYFSFLKTIIRRRERKRVNSLCKEFTCVEGHIFFSKQE